MLWAECFQSHRPTPTTISRRRMRPALMEGSIVRAGKRQRIRRVVGHVRKRWHRLRKPRVPALAGLLAVLAVLAAASGCLTFHRPEIAFRGVEVGSIGSSGLDLEANLDVHNPNSYKIGVEQLTYRLTVNGSDAGSGSVPEAIALPGKATTGVRLPLTLDWSKVKVAGLEFLTRGIDYAIEGEITFSTPIGVFHRPYRHEGRYAPLDSR
jgi:LEA14-like dessication related protein